MKTLGLIGGLSPYSTSVYYTTINRLVNERLGASNSAQLLLYSVNFNDFKTLQEKNDWSQIGNKIACIAEQLEAAGAECIVICANTPHLVADHVKQKINVPLLHIVDETAKEIVRLGGGKVGLVGTKHTMENSFFRDGLSRFGIESIIPDDAERAFIHNSIINELTKGIFKDETKNRYIEIFGKLKQNGAESVIFGCTEISLLVKPSESGITVFDTAAIHCRAAAEFALSD